MSDRKLQLVPNPARRGPFGALLDAAEHDVEAAKGLAYAYETMPLEQRERMVESIVEDAEGAARSPAPILALLLGVEDDERLAQRIAQGLDASVARTGTDEAHRWGDEERGGVVVIRHLFGAFAEAIAVEWDGAELRAETEALARCDDPSLVSRLGAPAHSAPVGLDVAVEALAEAIWRRRASEIPAGLRAFSDLF